MNRMKLNNYILGLLVAPALMFVGCSDYEDTDTVSPEADASAIGANFTSASTSVTMHPDKSSYTLTMNRVNTTNAATIQVTVTAIDTVASGAKFCDQPSEFVFAAGESTASVTLNVSSECLLQKTYTMSLKLGDSKDHIYAAGTSSTTVSFTKDYEWVTLGQSVVLEEGWYSVGEEAGISASVDWASDYTDNDGNMLVRIESLYANAFSSVNTSVAPGHFQFLLNSNYAALKMFDKFKTNGYDPAEVNTGYRQNASTEKEAIYYCLDFTNGGVAGGTYTSETTDGTTTYELAENGGYTFTYDVIYEGNSSYKTGVTAKLDYNFKSAIIAAKAE